MANIVCAICSMLIAGLRLSQMDFDTVAWIGLSIFFIYEWRRTHIRG